jgi:SSS family solute:Na+ symporter/sodium/pantothenate symporter
MPPGSTPDTGYGALVALGLFLVGSLAVGAYAERRMREGSFLQSYFLGNRGLGAWALALTATVQSGGTFMGYPAYVYAHGWIVGLWIASYMVVPIISFGIIAKRMSQLSRRTGAITVPDLFRERFGSPTAGLISSLLIMFLMSFTMVAQFKAGASIMKSIWPSGQTSAAATPVAPPATTTPDAPATAAAPKARAGIDRVFLIGLLVFTVTVVGYTMVGGFLAAVWTDMFQSILMWVGVMILLALTLWQLGGLEAITRGAVANTNGAFAAGPGFSPDGRHFLTAPLALSMFFVWTFGGLGSPATLVRLMACKDTPTIRRSVFLLAIYNFMIYLPLLVIAVAARAVMPNLASADEAIPRMAIWTTQGLPGGSLLAGLILIAPFGAVMATVSAYLVLIASGLVRDVYQRFLRPTASVGELRLLTFAVMLTVGLISVGANLYPVQYLQAIVVFCGSSGAATFVVPAVMTCFWRRGTAAGAVSAMLAGFLTCLTLLIIGCSLPDPLLGPATAKFRSFYLFGLEPVIWGLLASAVAGVAVSWTTPPPDETLLAKMFD